MLQKKKLKLPEVNRLCYTDFIDTFGNVVEKCPLLAAMVWEDNPFTSLDDLQSKFENAVDQLTLTGKSRLLRLLSPFGGKLERAGKLSPESKIERASAGLNTVNADERIRLSELSAKYITKFGFPFIVCARENTKESILKGMERRLNNSVAVEENTAITEIKKIANLRLRDLVEDALISKL
ncbi:2-oxo-4-hydroxy-4-carboxy-5-ureidoimidazoline decarboxylase-like [Mercenaria mercenaria]|uniref:2-oxo-4-hydroxy-4-carboxy-5-ureidoimidazoline decarboxylase-like n=1 Tax=Mercenaria mercenaria TaxID=6596 RepID=UPI00234F28C1|nr:2-oxo-4-hydroxy-4-carboxy-5-ureidoimidazoline decarboxylase-like [Mercenaria mercenaria]